MERSPRQTMCCAIKTFVQQWALQDWYMSPGTLEAFLSLAFLEPSKPFRMEKDEKLF